MSGDTRGGVMGQRGRKGIFIFGYLFVDILDIFVWILLDILGSLNLPGSHSAEGWARLTHMEGHTTLPGLVLSVSPTHLLLSSEAGNPSWSGHAHCPG